MTPLQEKVLLDGVIEPLKKYAKEESNVAGVRSQISRCRCRSVSLSIAVLIQTQEHIRKSRAATKAFDELTQKRTAQSLAKKTTTSDMLTILRAEKQEAEVRVKLDLGLARRHLRPVQLKTAMLHFLKAYDSHRCYKVRT